MELVDNRKTKLTSHGEFIIDKRGKIFVIIYEEDVKYPYHLVCLQQYSIIQSFDSIPSKKVVEEEIGSKIDGVFPNKAVKLTIE
ncbi:hypothetical protein [Bacillus sp. FJAT-45350]|uniref:hypothetical protein n=1 Tax=Bacillus sp. FJAT-45350 TaxID=2011014 RepID=UPI000BB6A6CE|nr:hypothetical protein [Bacillus sp. FJAT-45350]